MNGIETTTGISPVLSTAGLCVGGRVRLLSSIYDDGEDHHPPGYLAYHGEVLIVKEVRGDVLAVAHEGNPGAFTIYPGEYETHNAKVKARP
jgi:hypothetical protein